ncbi:MAG: AI-2E family transporter [Acidobacteriota bacterium]
MTDQPSQPASTVRGPDPPAEHAGYTCLLLTIIAVILLVAALKAAQAILVPVIVAVFLAIVGARPLRWLERRGVPSALAVFVVVGAIMVLIGLLGLLLGGSVNLFSEQLPVYEQRVEQRMVQMSDSFKGLGDSVSVRKLLESLDPSVAMSLVAGMLTGLRRAFANTFLILLTMIFILLEASSFPVKARSVLADSGNALVAFEKFTDAMNRYIVIKTVFSLITGVALAGWLALLGVDFAVMWGVLAFLLNYIPTIGSVLAAIPPILLGFIQYGAGVTILIGVGYLAVNVLLGGFLEPRVLGRGVGLSTLVVFLSLVFWGWVFGPVGMILAIPLTMTMKIALENNARTRWIAVLLGPAAVSQPTGGAGAET